MWFNAHLLNIILFTDWSHSVFFRIGIGTRFIGSALSIITVYARYSGHIHSGHSDIVATFPGTKYIYSLYLGRI